MATRWQIAAKLSSGMYGCIYVHYDGYPEDVMPMLQLHYTDQSKIDELIARGDHSSVESELDLCESYFSRGDEVWDDVKPTYRADMRVAAAEHRQGGEEYLYVWDGMSWAVEELRSRER